MIITDFEAVTDGFMASTETLQAVRPTVQLSEDVDARLIYRNSHHLLPDRSEMQLSVFAVREPGKRHFNALHTIEGSDDWPRVMYSRFTLNTVAVGPSGIILPERLHLPALRVQCSLGGLMLLGWGKFRNK